MHAVVVAHLQKRDLGVAVLTPTQTSRQLLRLIKPTGFQQIYEHEGIRTSVPKKPTKTS